MMWCLFSALPVSKSVLHLYSLLVADKSFDMIKYYSLMLFALSRCFALQIHDNFFLQLDQNKPDATTKLKFLHCNSSKETQSNLHCAFLCNIDYSCLAFEYKSSVCLFCRFVFNSSQHQVQEYVYIRQQNPTSSKLFLLLFYLLVTNDSEFASNMWKLLLLN